MTPVVGKIAKSTSIFMIGLLALFTPVAGLRAQQTINVPANQPTIQAAINAANNGDTVLVAPGTYTENINFNGKAITLTSSGGPSVSIIDGGAQGSVVTFNHSETTSSQLSGFTIRNGLRNGMDGAGILILNGSPTITRNVITANHAAYGLGISIEGGSPVIKNNTITGNDQTGAGAGGLGGGGLVVGGSGTGTASIQIIGNTITNNSVAQGGEGGGITVVASGGVIVQDNLISGNIAYNDGGGLYVGAFSNPFVVQNIIVGNTSLAGGHGGGLRIVSASGSAPSSYVNNTIAGNSAFDKASGIFINGFPQAVTFTNNIVVAADSQNAVTCDATYSTISPVFSHDDVYSASGQAWSGVCDSTSLPGNISADPLFLNAANSDFHLKQGSPAIDAGDNSVPNLPPNDFDGNLRIANGTVDLGAYELVPTAVAGIAPNSLSFSPRGTGTTSAPQLTTLTSTGTSPFQISSIQITGDFTQSTTCPTLGSAGGILGVPGGATCSFSIAFTPTALGPRAGLLTVNGTNGSSLLVSLSGTGSVPPAVSLSPLTVTFPSQLVATSSSSQSVILTNTGGSNLSISAISTTGDFAQNNGCGGSLSPSASCIINVIFAPSAYGSRTASLLISDNADGSPQSVSLSGTGVDFAIAPSTGSIAILRGYSAPITIYLTSLGDAFNNSVALSCSGLPSMSTCSFSPGSAIPGSSGATSSMTISTDQSNTQIGTFIVTITGQSGALSHSTQVQLTIFKFKRH